jgi:hypothetical protein
MKTRDAVLLLAAAGVMGAAGLASSPVAADGGGRPLYAVMSGAEEAPGPGDPDGSGVAVLRLNPGQEEVCYRITVDNIDPASAAHVHIAPIGVPGPVVIPLAPPTGGTSSGCVAASRALLKAILQDPSAYYVNVHNPAFPAGAVRGQLTK